MLVSRCPNCKAKLESAIEDLQECPYCEEPFLPWAGPVGHEPPQVVHGLKRNRGAVFLIWCNIMACLPVAVCAAAAAPRGQSDTVILMSMGTRILIAVGLFAILKWKKWGVYLIIACYLAHVGIAYNETQLVWGPTPSHVFVVILVNAFAFLFLFAVLKVRPQIWSRLR